MFRLIDELSLIIILLYDWYTAQTYWFGIKYIRFVNGLCDDDHWIEVMADLTSDKNLFLIYMNCVEQKKKAQPTKSTKRSISIEPKGMHFNEP